MWTNTVPGWFGGAEATGRLPNSNPTPMQQLAMG
jgi:hypothetical protein